MFKRSGNRGFTLIELLLVLAILGILGGITIPMYLGQRRRARIIGDAMSNSRSLAMMMEQAKAETGVYGTAGGTAVWTSSNTPSLTGFTANPCPGFTPSGNSQMYYTVSTPTALTYTITVTDPSMSGAPMVFQTDQTGAVLYKLK